jgi:signal peptidase I
MSKFIKKVFDLILILIIIVLVAYFILRYTNQIMIYRVKTGSMENDVHAGDYILIVKQNDYKLGDVVTFEKADGFITHRIVKKDGDMITTKGDANNVEDEEINKNTIVGKVAMSGGIINIVINYKYALIGFLLSIYLFSCYFSDDKKIDSSETKKKTKKNNKS